MVTNDKKLTVLESFIIDETLPKHKKANEELDNNPRGNLFIRTNRGVMSASSTGSFDIGGSWTVDGSTEKPSRFKRLSNKVSKVFAKKDKTIHITVAEYFKGIKDSAINIKNVQSRIDGYTNLLERAQGSGQVALAEKLIKNIDIVKYETQLVDAGFEVCISEADVVTFFVKSDRGISLDYIKNFTRIIPCEVIDAKNKLDALHVFDNYVIMHYDPNKEASEMTEKEVEDKKDPILFGLIQGSDKLYFVGDWIDDVCDLTFDELVEVLGEDGLDEKKLEVKMYGDVELIDCKE
jgi:hypothetical protein|tara:strand:- start:113 stop:991 length:879 start_codon:yes stop_codon:yes gene_type:complete